MKFEALTLTTKSSRYISYMKKLGLVHKGSKETLSRSSIIQFLELFFCLRIFLEPLIS